MSNQILRAKSFCEVKKARVINPFVLLMMLGVVISASKCKSSEQTSASQTEAIVYASEQQGPEDDADKQDEKVKEESEKNSESSEYSLWTKYSADDLPDLERRINPAEYAVWFCQYDQLLNSIEELPANLELPMNDGLQSFRLENSSTMSPALAAKFPQIKSMKGASDKGCTARVDTNDDGLFAEFKQNGEEYVLSPLLVGSKAYYALYNKNDLDKQPRNDDFEKN